MSRDGSGQYNLPSGNPYVNGTVIDETVVNATLSDIGTALTNSIAKDGQTTATANIPMGGFKLTNVAAGSTANQNPVISQIQDGSLLALGSVAGTNTITAALTPAISSYVAQMCFAFTPANANTGAVTIAINGLAAKAIVKGNGTALAANDLLTTVPALILYDGTSFVLLNPAGALPAYNGAALTNLNASNLASGTVPDGRFPATLPAASGENLTALNASSLGSGSIPDARVAQSSVTQHQAALSIAETQIPDGSVLARVGGNETITGAYSFTARPKTTSAGSFISYASSGNTGGSVTVSTSDPSGTPADGDLWFKREA